MYVKMLNMEEMKTVTQYFYEIVGFPRVGGTLDSTV